MWNFGITFDRDSVFIGGKTGTWVGLHLDFPWSKCCKQWGAPCKGYLHWWPKPKKCWTFKIPFCKDPPDPFENTRKGPKFVTIKRTCVVQGCTESKDLPGYHSSTAKIRYRDGIEVPLGLRAAVLCAEHARLMEDGKIDTQFVVRL